MHRFAALALICLLSGAAYGQTAPEPFCGTDGVPHHPYDAAATAAFVQGLPEVVRVPVLFLVARDGDEACDDFDCDPLLDVSAYDDMIDALNAFFGAQNSTGIETRFEFYMIGRSNVQDPELYAQTSIVNFAAVGVEPTRIVNVIIKSEGRSYVPTVTPRGIVYAREGIFPNPADPFRYSALIHEMGHFLGLSHTWGPNNGGSGQSCSDDDSVEDTPLQLGPNVACVPPPQQPPADTCPSDPGLDPVFNHMNYTPRDCRTQFTAGQAERMDGTLMSYNADLLLPTDDLLILSQLTPSAELPSLDLVGKTVYVLEGADATVTGALSVTGQTRVVERDEVHVTSTGSVTVAAGGEWVSRAPIGATERLRQDGAFAVASGGTLTFEGGAAPRLGGVTTVAGGTLAVDRTAVVSVNGLLRAEGSGSLFRLGSADNQYNRPELNVLPGGVVEVRQGAAYEHRVAHVSLAGGARMTVFADAAPTTFFPGFPFGGDETPSAAALAPGSRLEWLSPVQMGGSSAVTDRFQAAGKALGGVFELGGDIALPATEFQDLDVRFSGSGTCSGCIFSGGVVDVSGAVTVVDPILRAGDFTALDLTVGAAASTTLVARDLTLPVGARAALTGSTARFADGRRAVVQGELAAAGATFRADGSTWGGIRVEGTLALAGAVLQEVAGGSGQPGAVTVASGGEASLESTLVLGNNAAGVAAVGENARATLTGSTQVGNSSGAGVLAQDGGTVYVAGDEVQVFENAVGVDAVGTNAQVLITAGQIYGHDAGPAVRARDGARVDIWRPAGGGTGGGTPSVIGTTTLPVRVTGNLGGGLYALGKRNVGGFGTAGVGGTITTASNVVCVQEPCPYTVTGRNEFSNNWQATDAYDVFAGAGATVDATRNYWGLYDPARPDSVDISAVTAASVSVFPVLRDPPSSAQASARSLGHGAAKSGGSDFEGVYASIAEADRLALGNGSVLAGRALMDGFRLAETDAEREAVLAAAVRLSARTQPPALVAWVRARTLRPSAVRPWARRVLGEAYRAQARYADAVTVARALADEDGADWATDETAAGHRLRGLALIVRTETERGRLTEALNGLTEVAAVDAEVAAALAVSVAVAFPDADVSALRMRAPVSAKTGAVDAPAHDALSVWPNPTTGAFRVRLPVAAGAVRVTLVDALGRAVATLHDGPHAGGPLDLGFDGRALAPGVYVVRAQDGDAVTARAFTITR